MKVSGLRKLLLKSISLLLLVTRCKKELIITHWKDNSLTLSYSKKYRVVTIPLLFHWILNFFTDFFRVVFNYMSLIDQCNTKYIVVIVDRNMIKYNIPFF